MANSKQKDYHDEEYDASAFYETYIAADNAFSEDVMERCIEVFHNTFASDTVKGDTLIDASLSAITFQLFPAADKFKNIILLESSDNSIDTIQKWINKEPGAIDKSHVGMFHYSLKGESAGWEEQEEKVRSAIRKVLKWDINQEDSLSSLQLPKADCVISFTYLELACKTHDMYRDRLKQLSSLLNVGGHLMLFVVINISYYIVGKHTFAALTCNEEFIREAIADSGLVIKNSGNIDRMFDSRLTDLEYFAHFVCVKEN
ncbi:hypothetical protein GDO86_014803 [Hymenochirus boettgeri]|uniref:Uncharacterized protein n=1 Tax=Hymenochirus boettgeri TaxID=247094 RepID=A0A8T2JT03_9PIPI|nr:hypothetical protein GDO86_014803 [Hymenochirus boettgeri]